MPRCCSSWRGSIRSSGGPASSHSRIDVWCGEVLAGVELVRISPSRPKRSATTLCWWIVSRFSWRAETKCASRGLGELGRRRRRSSRARSPRRSAGGGGPSRRRRPRRSASSARRSPSSSSPRRCRAATRASRSVVAALRAADVQRAEAALVVRRDGDVLEDALDLVVAEAVRRAAARASGAGDELLRARAGGHALGGDADEPARAALSVATADAVAACRSPASGCRRPAPACARGSARRS